MRPGHPVSVVGYSVVPVIIACGAGVAALSVLSRVAQRGTVNSVIISFRHKGLRRFFESGSQAGIQAEHARNLQLRVSLLTAAVELRDVDQPGWFLHPLLGGRRGRWSIRVSGNWRLTFEFSDGNVYVLDYEDYH